MTYQPNIPLATDFISVSQQDINNNFTSLKSSFDVNHVTFNASGSGKHNFVEMPNQGSDPSGAAGQATLYAKSADLYVRRNAGTVYQLTYGAPGTGTTNSSSFLPGQYLVAWGRSSVSNNTAVTVSAFSTLYEVVFTIEDASGSTGGAAVIKSIAGNAFTVGTNGSVVIRWMAIGN